ncbi:MAG TPA: PIN domain-containing protein [Candidatus Brocadiia bacterium]|nr:PIN domain-containing protein [Candidatus Brocadiia bacterium]
MNVFVDTNVLLDVLARREAFYADSMRVWNLSESGSVSGFISAISFNNCFYVLKKYADTRKAGKAVRLLRDVFRPVDLTAQIINQAIDSGFPDFEDAIQYHSAVQSGSEFIVTRNPDHFPRSPISIMSPAEFLAVYGAE